MVGLISTMLEQCVDTSQQKGQKSGMVSAKKAKVSDGIVSTNRWLRYLFLWCECDFDR